ncbi:MAG: hypothetical protein K2X55_24000 [Burkholderiaceae bacterium]|nr:hypothetical protein [Burkholderiaceae bacterium]
MPPVSVEEKQRLCENVFELTGCKLDIDDPVVVAAFFFSKQMRSVAAENLKATDDLLLESEQRFDRRTQLASARLEALFVKHLASVRVEMRDVAVSALTHAMPTVRTNLEELVKQANRSSEGVISKHGHRVSSRAMLGSGLLIAAASFFAGYLWSQAPLEQLTTRISVERGAGALTKAAPTTAISTPESTQDRSQVRNVRPIVR